MRSLVSRCATLEVEFPGGRLESSDEYTELVEHVETHPAAVDAATGDMASDPEVVGAVRAITVEADETHPSIGGESDEEE